MILHQQEKEICLVKMATKFKKEKKIHHTVLGQNLITYHLPPSQTLYFLISHYLQYIFICKTIHAWKSDCISTLQLLQISNRKKFQEKTLKKKEKTENSRSLLLRFYKSMHKAYNNFEVGIQFCILYQYMQFLDENIIVWVILALVNGFA
jgi:hypothetical protein